MFLRQVFYSEAIITMQKSYLISFIFIILIVVFGVLINKQSEISQTLPKRDVPSEYMKKLKIHNYTPAGELKSFISGEYWEFINNKRVSLITKPKILIYKYPKHLYNVTADHGHIIHQQFSDEVYLIKLYSEVDVIQKYLEDSSNDYAFKLNTSYLEFNLKTEIATTEKKVTIYKPGLLVTGIGMNADLKLNQLELHEKVATTYKKIN
jgi:LPS export ABC transporter protein LptC